MGTINVTSGLYNRYDRMTLSKGGSIVSMGDRPSKDMAKDYGPSQFQIIDYKEDTTDFPSNRKSTLVGSEVIPKAFYATTDEVAIRQSEPGVWYVKILGSGTSTPMPSGFEGAVHVNYRGLKPPSVMPSGQPSCGSITNCFDYEYTKRIDNAKALCLDPTFGLKPGDIAPNSENAARKAAALYFIGGNANGQGDNYNGNSNCFQESQTKPSATAGLNAATKRSQDLPEEILGAARRERNKSPDVDWLHIKCAPCSDGDPCIQTLLLADLMNMNPDTSQGTFNVEVSNASVNVYGYSDGYAKVNYSLTIKCRARLFIFCDDANC